MVFWTFLYFENDLDSSSDNQALCDNSDYQHNLGHPITRLCHALDCDKYFHFPPKDISGMPDTHCHNILHYMRAKYQKISRQKDTCFVYKWFVLNFFDHCYRLRI